MLFFVKNLRCVLSRTPLGLYSQFFRINNEKSTERCKTFGIEETIIPLEMGCGDPGTFRWSVSSGSGSTNNIGDRGGHKEQNQFLFRPGLPLLCRSLTKKRRPAESSRKSGQGHRNLQGVRRRRLGGKGGEEAGGDGLKAFKALSSSKRASGFDPKIKPEI